MGLLKRHTLLITVIILVIIMVLLVYWATDQLIHHLDEKMPY